MQAKRPRAVDDLDLPILGDEQIPNILWDRGDKLKTIHALACDRAAIRRVPCWCPELFLVNDFTVLGAGP